MLGVLPAPASQQHQQQDRHPTSRPSPDGRGRQSYGGAKWVGRDAGRSGAGRRPGLGPKCGVRRETLDRCSSPSHRRRAGGETSTVPTARSTPTASPAVANNPERSRRVAEMWSARPDWSEKEILEAVDAQLAEEAETLTPGGRPLPRPWPIPSERCTSAGVAERVPPLAARSAACCRPCQRVEQVLLAEQAAASPIPGGGSRRDAVEADLAAKTSPVLT